MRVFLQKSWIIKAFEDLLNIVKKLKIIWQNLFKIIILLISRKKNYYKMIMTIFEKNRKKQLQIILNNITQAKNI